MLRSIMKRLVRELFMSTVTNFCIVPKLLAVVTNLVFVPTHDEL